MHSPEIKKLLDSVESEFGDYEYYGSSDKEYDGVGFKIQGISASFSVRVLESDWQDVFDIQVEGIPPGSYVFTDHVTLSEFLDLLSIYSKDQSQWP